MADAFDFNDEVEAMTKKSDRPEDFESFVIKHENRLYRTALSIMPKTWCRKHSSKPTKGRPSFSPTSTKKLGL